MERGRNRCRTHFFQILDIWSSSGDIRDQSRKLSEIAPKFGHFLALPNFRGRAFQKLYPRYDPARCMENVLWGYSHWRKVIGVHTLNFKPNFRFSRLEFFWGDPRPTSGVRYQGLVNL